MRNACYHKGPSRGSWWRASGSLFSHSMCPFFTWQRICLVDCLLRYNISRFKELVGLSKTRWFEKHKVYETYLLLFKATAFTLESICKLQLYGVSRDDLQTKYNEKWIWDRDSKITAEVLFTTTWPFDSILVFYVFSLTLLKLWNHCWLNCKNIKRYIKPVKW